MPTTSYWPPDSLGSGTADATTVLHGDNTWGNIGSGDIAPDSITSTELAPDSVTSTEIAGGAVGTTELADDSVTSAKIAADAVGPTEIAADAVGSSEIAANAVGSSELADGAVTDAKITGPLSAQARVGVRKNSSGSTFVRRRLNLIEGTNVTITAADDSTDEEVDITIAASGGGASALDDLTDVTISSPASGQVLEYNGAAWVNAALNQIVWNETPSGTVNGSNTVFTLANSPNPSTSLMLYKNGLLMEAGGVDYTLSGATITFAAGQVPQTGDILLASYQNGTGGVSAPIDGWLDDTAETWTYASSTTFTVTGDKTSKYTVGTKLKLTQTTVKYFVVTAVAVAGGTTTVTLTGGTDYTLANAAISANYHSYEVNPQGWPGWFNWTPGYTGFSANPPSTTARFRVDGRLCTVVLVSGNGTSNATSFTVTGLPIAPAQSVTAIVQARDNNTGCIADAVLTSSSTTCTLNRYRGDTNVFTTWTASSTKNCDMTLAYEI